MNQTKKTIAIVGGGAGGIMLAEHLNEELYNITIYEQNASLGRKLLVAGAGGFNLTHSQEAEKFIANYSPTSFLEKCFPEFSNVDLINFLKQIGVETYIGSSKRVFPINGIKPIDVVNTLLNELHKKKINIQPHHTWKGWNKKNELVFETKTGQQAVHTDITVFALGGGSWKVTGSNGDWVSYFNDAGIETKPFEASNCAVKINWNADFILANEGKAIKNISLHCGTQQRKGEVVITKQGMEGGALYAIIGAIRMELNEKKTAIFFIDLNPQIEEHELKTNLTNRGNKSWSRHLKDVLSLSTTQVDLLKNQLTKEEFTNVTLLTNRIKHLPFSVTALAPLDEAISTVGGVPLSSISSNFELKNKSSNYCIGEMLDWDAPTGGYLLQACFSMGVSLARHLNRL